MVNRALREERKNERSRSGSINDVQWFRAFVDPSNGDVHMWFPDEDGMDRQHYSMKPFFPGFIPVYYKMEEDGTRTFDVAAWSAGKAAKDELRKAGGYKQIMETPA